MSKSDGFAGRAQPPLIRAHIGLRGVAALLVVAYHLQLGQFYHLRIEEATALPRRGYLAVDLFFILSGFIIGYVNHADRRAAMRWGEITAFWRARFARLYPLLAFSLAAMVLLALAEEAVFVYAGRTPSSVDLSGRSLAILASQAMLVNAWIPDFAGWNVPTWSISAEVAAYLLFPVLVAAHARARTLSRVAMILVACGFYGAVALTSRSLDIIAGLAPLRCLAGFLIGLQLFHGRRHVARLTDRVLTTIQLASAIAIVVLLALPTDDPLVIPFYAALVATTWPDRGLLAWALARRPVVWLGEISYSVYLNHVGVMHAMNLLWPRIARALGLAPPMERAVWIAIVFATVILWSGLTFCFVERPARRWLIRRFSGKSASSIAASPPGP